jgi:CPA2 family monovalent cation:H+ antiporter-2
VARIRSQEPFVAACLLVVIGAGLVAVAAGLSKVLGAVIGGLLLAGTEYRRQVEVTIEPFKGLFLGVFFVSVGMTLDIRTLVANPLLVLGASGGMILVKSLVVTPLARVFGVNWRDALRMGLLLGPGGEICFRHRRGCPHRALVSAGCCKHGIAPDRRARGPAQSSIEGERSASTENQYGGRF